MSIDPDDDDSLEARVTRLTYSVGETLEGLADSDVVREKIVELAIFGFAVGLLHSFGNQAVEIEHALQSAASKLKQHRLSNG
ncbi:hypothetical protein [Caulobacter sp. NIBR2454]|uniref:hypothetical protein n=1 Tax=Caulobacter sp. NIBR2454 TaxID=3015996 RepID=UPI0022B63F9D|nr:hypothetical protein [Caulobacter sp. NIBR2454]